jgi:hypothetical protein
LDDDDDGDGMMRDSLGTYSEARLDDLVRYSSVTAGPVWSPIRRPVARCEYCGLISLYGEIKCPGCGAMR